MTRFGDAIERAREIQGGLAADFARVSSEHDDEPDVFHLCKLMAQEAEEQANRLAVLAARQEVEEREPPTLVADLAALYLRVQEAWIHATILRQAALANRDRETLAAADAWLGQAAHQAKWLRTQIKTTVPQALTVE